MGSPTEFQQIELMNQTLRRIANALEKIANAIAPEEQSAADSDD